MRIMMEELKDGLARAGIKDILQNGVIRQGRKYICNFFNRTGLMKSI